MYVIPLQSFYCYLKNRQENVVAIVLRIVTYPNETASGMRFFWGGGFFQDLILSSGIDWTVGSWLLLLNGGR